MQEQDYKNIVDGCRRGNRQSQRTLYEMSREMAMGVCMRYASCRDEAQDMMQDGYVKVFEKIHSLRQPETVMAWIYRVMTNTCILAVGRSKFEYAVCDAEPFCEPINCSPELQHDIAVAMQGLTPRLRLVVNLHDIEGYTSDEVAKTMHTNVENVRVMLMRARRALRERLR